MSIIRSCLQSLVKNDPEVSQRLRLCVPRFVGVGDRCLFSPEVGSNEGGIAEERAGGDLREPSGDAQNRALKPHESLTLPTDTIEKGSALIDDSCDQFGDKKMGSQLAVGGEGQPRTTQTTCDANKYPQKGCPSPPELSFGEALNKTNSPSIDRSSNEACPIFQALPPAPHFFKPCLGDPDSSDEFNLILECPTDAIAYHLDLALPNHINTLALAVPAVEIWIEGPSYGSILSLKAIKVLNSGKEIAREKDMVSTTTERTDEFVGTSPIPMAEEVTKSPHKTLSLRALATAINRSEKELYPIMGEMRLTLLPQSDGTLAINKQDAATIVLRWAEKIDEATIDENYEHGGSAATDTASTHETSGMLAHDRGKPKKEKQSRTRTLNREASIAKPEIPRLIQYKPRLTARDIKDKAIDTFKAIIEKVHNKEHAEVIQGIVSENEIGQEIMGDVQQLFNKKKPGGRVNLYLSKFKEAAVEEMRMAVADSSQAAA